MPGRLGCCHPRGGGAVSPGEGCGGWALGSLLLWGQGGSCSTQLSPECPGVLGRRPGLLSDETQAGPGAQLPCSWAFMENRPGAGAGLWVCFLPTGPRHGTRIPVAVTVALSSRVTASHLILRQLYWRTPFCGKASTRIQGHPGHLVHLGPSPGCPAQSGPHPPVSMLPLWVSTGCSLGLEPEGLCHH